MSKRRQSARYGVKTLDRVSAAGKPKFTDSSYSANSTLIEERIVLFRANSFEDAIEKAEKEARTYASSIRYPNVYSQKVRAR